MRRFVPAVLAAAILLPAGQAGAVPPPCEVVDDMLYALMRTAPTCRLIRDAPYTVVTLPALAVACERVYGTLPGTTPAYESGEASCIAAVAIGSTKPSWAYSVSAATLRYESTSPSTLSSGAGTWTLISHFLGVTFRGTYVRVGSTWTIEDVHVPEDPALLFQTTRVLAGTGQGAPVVQGLPVRRDRRLTTAPRVERSCLRRCASSTSNEIAAGTGVGEPQPAGRRGSSRSSTAAAA